MPEQQVDIWVVDHETMEPVPPGQYEVVSQTVLITSTSNWGGTTIASQKGTLQVKVKPFEVKHD